MVEDIVSLQIKSMTTETEPFDEKSKITQYYKMLPESNLKDLYNEMLLTIDIEKKEEIKKILRNHIIPGSIDVNIMTKLDSDNYHEGEKLPQEFSDALSALRGYAKSNLNSSIIFSAGMNPRLFAYTATFDDFFPDKNGIIKKKIILKVSDYRSAMIQGKYLIKRGLWVSEYRIESGGNCGGHAFISNGKLMGPILEEFKEKKDQLLKDFHSLYITALEKRGKYNIKQPLKSKITVQGGINSALENNLLQQYYDVDATGWGTPFLFVPEATNVDEEHLQKLIEATDKDIYLSNSSPLGIPFWNLKTSSSETKRLNNICKGTPGSICTKSFAITNTEFTELPICVSSKTYQKYKLEELAKKDLTKEQRITLEKDILDKACICNGLAGSALLKNKIFKDAEVTICCGPSAAYFSKLAKLEEMVDHIYGRISLLSESYGPHMFIKEIKIYINSFQKEIKKYSQGFSHHPPKYFQTFQENLNQGIEYYSQKTVSFFKQLKQQEYFLQDLKKLKEELKEKSRIWEKTFFTSKTQLQ
jgi:hypothetical protein